MSEEIQKLKEENELLRNSVANLMEEIQELALALVNLSTAARKIDEEKNSLALQVLTNMVNQKQLRQYVRSGSTLEKMITHVDQMVENQREQEELNRQVEADSANQEVIDVAEGGETVFSNGMKFQKETVSTVQNEDVEFKEVIEDETVELEHSVTGHTLNDSISEESAWDIWSRNRDNFIKQVSSFHVSDPRYMTPEDANIYYNDMFPFVNEKGLRTDQVVDNSSVTSEDDALNKYEKQRINDIQQTMKIIDREIEMRQEDNWSKEEAIVDEVERNLMEQIDKDLEENGVEHSKSIRPLSFDNYNATVRNIAQETYPEIIKETLEALISKVGVEGTWQRVLSTKRGVEDKVVAIANRKADKLISMIFEDREYEFNLDDITHSKVIIFDGEKKGEYELKDITFREQNSLNNFLLHAM